MKEDRRVFQMKEKDKTPETQLKQMNNLCNEEFMQWD